MSCSQEHIDTYALAGQVRTESSIGAIYNMIQLTWYIRTCYTTITILRLYYKSFVVQSCSLLFVLQPRCNMAITTNGITRLAQACLLEVIGSVLSFS